MKIFTSSRAKVYIIDPTGFVRVPLLSEVELAENKQENRKIKFEGTVGDQKIKTCICKKNEIIIEKFENTFLISKAYAAKENLYDTILKLAITWKCIPEIKYCENPKDLYNLDKITTGYKKLIENT